MTAVTVDVERRYPAGRAHYPGDCTHIVGELKGPRVYGGHVVAAAAEYDPVSDVTTVVFETVTDADMRGARPDASGIWRVSETPS